MEPETKANDPPTDYTGYCYCKGVEFVIPQSKNSDDTMAVFCHCDSCRRAHSAPLYQVVYVAPEQFQITRGEDLVNRFCLEGARVERWFCSQCGSRIANHLIQSSTPSRSGFVGFFPSLLAPEFQVALPKQFIPSRHSCPEESILEHGKELRYNSLCLG